MIYFDQAATSHPKPQAVIDAVVHAMQNMGGNAGRGTHKGAQSTSALLSNTRKEAAALFGCSRADHVLFFPNATYALNQAIKGFELKAGDHVITTAFEHNSVRRPLSYVQQDKHIDITFLNEIQNNMILMEQIKQAITPKTKLLVLTHGSNVTGDVLSIAEAAAVAKSYKIPILVDASQTAGHIPINMKQDGIDMLAMPGHKGLMGPQGTGMLLVAEHIDLQPIYHGGTGNYSEDVNQPDVWPQRFESGTLNIPGIAGLHAALSMLKKQDIHNVPRETFLAQRIRSALDGIPNVVIYGPDPSDMTLPIVAFNVHGVDSQEIAMILDSSYDIAVRAGLHCSPLAHEALNTIQTGVIRVSLGVYNTETETDFFIQALRDIAAAYAQL